MLVIFKKFYANATKDRSQTSVMSSGQITDAMTLT